MKSYTILPMLLVLSASSLRADDKPQKTEPTKPAAAKPAAAQLDKAALEKQFAEKLSGAALIGLWTTDGQKEDQPARPDRYELVSVSKVRDDYFLFVAQMKYANKEYKMPLTLKVAWAGDTPILSLTDFTVPGMGTFTTRIMFYGDRYAGTWQHGPAGGHMWGKIEPAKKGDTPAPKPAAKPDAGK